MSTATNDLSAGREQLRQEFKHLRSSWCWLFSYGVFLAVLGTVAVIVPAATVKTSIAAMVVLGLVLMGSGVVTMITAYWAGKFGAQLLQLLCGVMYVVAGYVISDRPVKSAMISAAFIASFFIVLGLFRILAALTQRFPMWGWALLNGAITLMCGLAIYRHFGEESIWIVGLLVGLEMLFHGWNWIMLSLAIRKIPADL